MKKPQIKVALVTGGAQGIGLIIARTLLKRDWRVVISDLQREAGEEARRALEAHGPVRFVAGDVAREEDVRQMVSVCLQDFGALTALVNNAGRMGPRKPLEQVTLAEWRSVLDSNLTGMFLLARECAAELRRAGGSIVNIASTRAQMSEPNTFAYSASKGGVVALTHCLAASLAPVRVNCISPGWIDVDDAPLRQEDHEQHWAGRVGKPQDVAELVSFLLSDKAGFVTGVDYVVDGGMTRKMIYAE